MLDKRHHGNEEDTERLESSGALSEVHSAAKEREKEREGAEKRKTRARTEGNTCGGRTSARRSYCTVYTKSFCLHSGGFLRRIKTASKIRRVNLQGEEVKMRKYLQGSTEPVLVFFFIYKQRGKISRNF